MSEFEKLLKECPWCHVKKNHVEDNTHEENGVAYVVCEACGARGPIASTYLKAFAAWNRREACP